MDNLQDLKERAIRSMEQNDSGHNSYLIIKFTDDSKLNVSSFPYENGSGRLEISYEDIKVDEVKNKKIAAIAEELDSDKTEKLIIAFKGGGKMIVKSYNVIADGTAGLELSAYIANTKKLVAESLRENQYKDGRFGQYIMNSPQYEEADPEESDIENEKGDMENFVDEDLVEFVKRDGDYDREEFIESTDAITEEAPEISDEDIENELSGTTEMENLNHAIDNEIATPEFSRVALNFKLKGSEEDISGVPMARMAGGEFVLFKTPGGLRKIFVNDIIIESEEPIVWVKESLENE